MIKLQKEYTSIDDLMSNERDTIQDILNDQDLYRYTVGALGYQRITIRVNLAEPKDDVTYREWTSFNDGTGTITSIEDGHHTVEDEARNLYTTIEEEDLLSVANNVYNIQKDPLGYIPAYMFKFRMDVDTRKKIVKTALKHPIIVMKIAGKGVASLFRRAHA